jgi:hypothetical protein
MHLTSKQISQMRVICAGNSDGTDVDLDQILEKLPYQTTKQSFQFSLRALIAKGLVEEAGREVRRGRSRRVISPTGLGKSYFPSRSLASILTAPEIE